MTDKVSYPGISEEEQERFLSVCNRVLTSEREKNGIGTLGEKSLHAVLKAYYEPLGGLHEQKLGRYVADILNENGVTEIQTRHLSAMKKKLEAFLTVTHVTLIHPVTHKKWLSWVNPETGEMSAKRRSPKTGTVYDAAWELGGIPEFLTNPALEIHIVLLDMEETRFLNGWSHDKKRGSSRCDRIPTAFCEEIVLKTQKDYRIFLPKTLEKTFTTGTFAKEAHLTRERAYQVLRILRVVGLIEECGKSGREKQYRQTDI